MSSSDNCGAGDQGIMFGYACNETENFMPAPIYFSHRILKKLANYRHDNDSFFGPDSKKSSEFFLKTINRKISSIVVSSQHSEKADNRDKKEILEIIEMQFPIKYYHLKIRF